MSSDPILPTLAAFAPLFCDRVFVHAEQLALGAVLTVGRRTVASALRALGRADERHFTNFHRVLNRARWDALDAARILLFLIISTLVAAGAPIVLAADDTVERRSGAKVFGRGLYRDPTRSTRRYPTLTWGLKWIAMAVLVRLPFSGRVWALPFLTVLAPGPKCPSRRRAHKAAPRWVCQMIGQVRRWVPERAIVLVVDGGYACLQLAHTCRRTSVVMVSRMRQDARIYHEPGPRRPGTPGRRPLKGARQRKISAWATRSDTPWRDGEVTWYGGETKRVRLYSRTGLWHRDGHKPVAVRWVLVRDPEGVCRDEAIFCTDPQAEPEQIVAWFVMRWSLEVTFEEARAHLGVETQRQWSEQAVRRTTPVLLGLFSVVVLEAKRLWERGELRPTSSAWYAKTEPTFVDCLALVRRQIWSARYLANCPDHADRVEFQRDQLERLLWPLLSAA